MKMIGYDGSEGVLVLNAYPVTVMERKVVCLIYIFWFKLGAS